MHHEMDYNLRSDFPEEVKADLSELRRGLIELNKQYQDETATPSTKDSAARNFFTLERLTTINDLNTRISFLHRVDYERWFEHAVDSALESAEERLAQLHPDRHIYCEAITAFTTQYKELHNPPHSAFKKERYMHHGFFMWRSFEVMLNESKNEWCFVFTAPYTFISKLIGHLIEHHPYRFPRCLEYGFRKLLGDYRHPLEPRGAFDKDYRWIMDKNTGAKRVTRCEIEGCFKSCRAQFYK